MKKQVYTSAELEITKLRMEDVIATSNPSEGGSGSEDFGDVDPGGWT